MYKPFLKFACCIPLGLLSACAMLTAQNPEQAERDWVEYSADVLAMSALEQQALHAAAVSAHDADPSGESALVLAILTVSVAQSAGELARAAELTELAAAEEGAGVDRSFVSLLQSFIDKLLQQERSLEREREERQALQTQLNALRQLEQELNAQ